MIIRVRLTNKLNSIGRHLAWPNAMRARNNLRTQWSSMRVIVAFSIDPQRRSVSPNPSKWWAFLSCLLIAFTTNPQLFCCLCRSRCLVLGEYFNCKSVCESSVLKTFSRYSIASFSIFFAHITDIRRYSTGKRFRDGNFPKLSCWYRQR